MCGEWVQPLCMHAAGSWGVLHPAPRCAGPTGLCWDLWSHMQLVGGIHAGFTTTLGAIHPLMALWTHYPSFHHCKTLAF